MQRLRYSECCGGSVFMTGEDGWLPLQHRLLLRDVGQPAAATPRYPASCCVQRPVSAVVSSGYLEWRYQATLATWPPPILWNTGGVARLKSTLRMPALGIAVVAWRAGNVITCVGDCGDRFVDGHALVDDSDDGESTVRAGGVCRVAATPATKRNGPLPLATARDDRGKGKVSCLCLVNLPLVVAKVNIAPLSSPTSTSFLMGVRLTHVRRDALGRHPTGKSPASLISDKHTSLSVTVTRQLTSLFIMLRPTQVTVSHIILIMWQSDVPTTLGTKKPPGHGRR
ncbi:hypothetical protein E2C01_025668 [Portunus trituberculatus]|uniref:Uncharacterized protein n=1 Tax=Portunus trituberculatus TaxID=210409 RepID=A0A5B7EG19_PORTR|nr:hypothetical protein [Portunus trituberculatus]